MAVVRPEIKVTYRGYRALPETGPQYQLIDGELYMSPAPNIPHQTAVGALFAALFAFVKEHRLGRVFCAPTDVILSNYDVFQPDILFISKSRRSFIAKEGIRGGPDLCVEVLSPRTRRIDIGVKLPTYARHGVLEYWIIEPQFRRVDVYRLQEDQKSPVATFGRRDTLTTRLLPGFHLRVRDIFA